MHRRPKILLGFIWTIEEDLGSGDAVGQGFAVFKNADNFRPGAFVMENPANGIEVIGLVRPGHLNFGITGAEGSDSISVGLAYGLFRQNKARRSVLFHQFGHGYSVNFSNGNLGVTGSEFVAQARIQFAQIGSFVGF